MAETMSTDKASQLDLRLYTFFRSSAAFRVRIALNLKGLDYQSIPVHFRKNGGEHRQPDFLRRNPQGLLPVLEHEPNVITQSLAIVEYLDATFPEPRLIPAAPNDRAKVEALAQIVACDIHPLNNLRVLNYLRQQLGQDDEAVTNWVQHWVTLGFEGYEGLIKAHSNGRFSCGDSVTLADICLVPQVYNAVRFGCDLSSFPTIKSVDEHLKSLPAFMSAAPEQQADAE